ncbi:hypothetical protein SSX86_003801 [Deinandra increscens subsp. villosa]|uniref:C2H2-type domain-containing protein n=1 Tax=Deinandra increscens subsp. villosa TaxID=3103831 RepID=A0AAP0H8E6_9ASTR
MSETVNNVLVTPRKPEEIRPFKCEVCNITCNTEDLLEKHKQGKKHLKLADDSSANAPKTATPAIASETLVGELVNKQQQGLLQHGARTDSIFCHLCNVVCYNQEIFQKHVVGKKHSAKAIIQLASQSGFFAATSYPSHGGSQKKPPTFQCGLCKITCTSNELLKLHIAGKKHLNKLKESGQIPNLPLVNPDEGKTVNSDGSNRNGKKRAGSHEDVESKKQKVLQGGAALDAIRTCDLCNVVCNSPTVYDAHLEGQKHAAAMAVKHAETTAQQS